MGYDYQAIISEMRDRLNVLMRDIAQTNTKLADCPTTNCLTTMMFLLFVAIQMIILLAYSLYRYIHLKYFLTSLQYYCMIINKEKNELKELILFILLYRDNKEAQAKKFY